MFAVNDDETAAEACGINSKNTKILAFGISAALADSREVSTPYVGISHPEPFVFFESGNAVAMPS